MIIGEAQRRGWRGGRQRRAVGGKEAARFGLAGVRVEYRQRFGPGRVLRVVEIAQREQRLLMHRAGSVAPIFHDTPVAMFLAVLLSFGGA